MTEIAKLFLLGGFRIEKDQAARVPLTGRRGAAVIAYLARAPGMAASRERLADLLWSDSDADHARNSLRQTLSVLRRDLTRAGLDFIHARNDMIGIDAQAIEVDAQDLEARLSARSAHELEAALAVYRGPFLDGLHVGGNPFDDWAALEREKLHNHAIEAIERLARLVDPDAGLILADRLIAMEPTREASYRLKMELLLSTGHRDRAVRTYETCRAVLKKEFGVDVGTDLQALRQSISPAGDAPPRSVAPTNGVPNGPRRRRPSISVAGFVNLTGERGDDYFARGLVQDVTTALSEVSDYVVLSGASPVETTGGSDGSKSAGAPRAHYVLGGSVQRSGNGLRVNVQLVDAASGQHVWAQRFDGQADNPLDFQDRIARSVVLAVTLELQLTNWKVRDKSPPGPPEVRRLVNEALSKYFEMTRDSLIASMDLAERAHAIAPENARAKRTLSIAITMSIALGTLAPEREHIERALDLAAAAVRAVPDDEIARVVLSFALECAGRVDEAIVECRHAISLNPSYPSARGDIAALYALRGQVTEALHEANESIRLGTHDVIDFWRHHSMVMALFAGGEDRRALEVARNVVRTKPGFVRGALYWAAAARATGNSDEASRAIHHCLSQLPHLNLGNVSPGFVPRYVKDQTHARFLDMLARAGLPAS